MTLNRIMGFVMTTVIVLVVIWVLNRPALPTRPLIQAALR